MIKKKVDRGAAAISTQRRGHPLKLEKGRAAEVPEQVCSACWAAGEDLADSQPKWLEELSVVTFLCAKRLHR